MKDVADKLKSLAEVIGAFKDDPEVNFGARVIVAFWVLPQRAAAMEHVTPQEAVDRSFEVADLFVKRFQEELAGTLKALAAKAAAP